MTKIPTLQRFSHTATISPAQRADGDGGEGSNADRHTIPSAVPIPPTQAGPEETFSGRDRPFEKPLLSSRRAYSVKAEELFRMGDAPGSRRARRQSRFHRAARLLRSDGTVESGTRKP